MATSLTNGNFIGQSFIANVPKEYIVTIPAPLTVQFLTATRPGTVDSCNVYLNQGMTQAHGKGTSAVMYIDLPKGKHSFTVKADASTPLTVGFRAFKNPFPPK